MGYYKDLSQYREHPKGLKGAVLLPNVLNIGWLGQIGDYERGEVSREFITNLVEYYRCRVYWRCWLRSSYYNYGLDGSWAHFNLKFGGCFMSLGTGEIRVADKSNGIMYAAPDLIIHYILNHGYLPPEEFINAVISGPKPDSKEYCSVVQEAYRNAPKLEVPGRSKCPYCDSYHMMFVYQEKKVYKDDNEILVLNSDIMPQPRDDDDKYNHYFVCESCGRLSVYNFR